MSGHSRAIRFAAVPLQARHPLRPLWITHHRNFSVLSCVPDAYNCHRSPTLPRWSMPMTRAMIGLMVLSALALPARADEKAKPIEGAWKQVEQKNGTATEYQKLPDGTVMTDCIVGGRFIWTV